MALALGACTGPSPGPRPLLAPAYAQYVATQGRALLPGSVLGQAFRLEGSNFLPAQGAQLRLDDGPVVSVADQDGLYGFEGLSPGKHLVEAQLEGHGSFRLQVVVNAAAGLPRANLLLLPKAGGPALAGVVVDPRGAAVPGGVAEAADAPSGARISATANGAGLYRVELPPTSSLPPRLVNLGGHGRSPGGVNLDASRVQELSLSGPSSVALALDAFRQSSSPQWQVLSGRRLQVMAQDLPSRPDEMVLHWEDARGAFEVIPFRMGGGSLEAELPVDPSPGGRLELRTFGVVPPGQSAPSLSP